MKYDKIRQDKIPSPQILSQDLENTNHPYQQPVPFFQFLVFLMFPLYMFPIFSFFIFPIFLFKICSLFCHSLCFLKGVHIGLEVELRQVVLSPIQSQDQTTSYQMEAIFSKMMYQFFPICTRFNFFSDVLNSLFLQKY